MVVSRLPNREEWIVRLAFGQRNYLLYRCAQVPVINAKELGEIIKVVEIDQVIQQNRIVEFGLIQIEALKT